MKKRLLLFTFFFALSITNTRLIFSMKNLDTKELDKEKKGSLKRNRNNNKNNDKKKMHVKKQKQNLHPYFTKEQLLEHIKSHLKTTKQKLKEEEFAEEWNVKKQELKTTPMIIKETCKIIVEKKDKPDVLFYEAPIVVALIFYKDADSSPLFLIETLQDLLQKESLWNQEFLKDITKLHIATTDIYSKNFNLDDFKKLSKKILTTIPNVKNLEICNCSQTASIVSSLLSKNDTWKLSHIKIETNDDFYISDDAIIDIIDQLSKIPTLKSGILEHDSLYSSIGYMGLHYIAQSSFIKNLDTLTLNYNTRYIDEEGMDGIKNLLQKNMHKDATICFNKKTITKQTQNNATQEKVNDSLLNVQDDYTICIMWINKKPYNLFACKPTFNEKDIVEYVDQTDDVITCGLTWAQKNPKAKILICYDGKFVIDAPEIIQNIRQKFKIESQNSQISFMDIRKLDLVKEKPEIFSEKTPTYFHADLLREIVTYEMLTKKKTSCLVYADIDVTPMNIAKLFDIETTINLKKYGFVFNRTPLRMPPIENSFQITVNNQNALKAIKDILIDGSILITEKLLNQPSTPNYIEKLERLKQFVYNMFPLMVTYFHFLTSKITFAKEMLSENSITDSLYETMSAYFLNTHGTSMINDAYILTEPEDFTIFYPTKFTETPRASGNYY